MLKPSNASKPGKKLSSREIGMGFVTLVLLLFGYSKYWYSAKNVAIEDWNRKMILVQKEIETNKQVVDGLQKRMTASTQGVENDSLLKNYLATSRRVAQLVQQLISEDLELVTRLIEVKNAEKEKEYREVAFQVEIEGSFPGIGAFVERLEKSRILAEVTDLDITRVDGDLEKVSAKFAVTARLFAEKFPGEADK